VLPPTPRCLREALKNSTKLGKRKRGAQGPKDIYTEARDWEEEERELAAQLQVPLETLPDMLADDREDLEQDSVRTEVPDSVGEGVPGSLLKFKTIEVCVAAVAELHAIQHATGTNPSSSFRGPALSALLKAR